MADADQFARLLDELVRSKGVELPNIPETAGRAAYLRFLGNRGYQEEELLPVIQRDRVTPEAHGALLAGLLQAVQSEDPNFVKAIAWMAHNTILGRDNTNLIIYQLAASLVADFEKVGIRIPPFYAGVFPTDSYNAQYTVYDGENIVLLDTGCLEMAESIGISFLSKAETAQKVKEISSSIDQYVTRVSAPTPYNRAVKVFHLERDYRPRL
jgi:hypothetical protein